LIVGAIRFLWNATRGHRWTPWRSEYLKWRIETYSGKRAGTIGFRDFWQFVFEQKGQLLHFLRWTAEMETWERTKPRAH
jgi:hypothetical protein